MDFEADIKIKPNETPAERSHRLRMEARRYWFGEALINLAAIGIAVAGTIAAMIMMFRTRASVDDKKWEFSVLTHLLIAVGGFAFGKATK